MIVFSRVESLLYQNKFNDIIDQALTFIGKNDLQIPFSIIIIFYICNDVYARLMYLLSHARDNFSKNK